MHLASMPLRRGAVHSVRHLSSQLPPEQLLLAQQLASNPEGLEAFLAAVEAEGGRGKEEKVSNLQLRRLALQTAVPFVGFGCTDNSLMILTGDLIDGWLGMTLGFSTMAAAALGNACSNSTGMFLHGVIERVARMLGLPDPRLSNVQRASAVVQNVRTASSVLGVAVGCILGMFPLLLFDANATQEQKVKARDGRGKL